MGPNRILFAIFGLLQSIVGIVTGIVTLLLGLNVVGVETVFNLPPELLPLYILILGSFSIFSFINGLFLIRDWRALERRKE